MEGSEQTQAHVPWFFFGIRLANRVASVSNGLGKLMSRAASPNGTTALSTTAKVVFRTRTGC
jgi:hypothetical protein